MSRKVHLNCTYLVKYETHDLDKLRQPPAGLEHFFAKYRYEGGDDCCLFYLDADAGYELGDLLDLFEHIHRCRTDDGGTHLNCTAHDADGETCQIRIDVRTTTKY